MYSPAAYVPWLLCPCAIIGTEYVPSTTVMSFQGEQSFLMHQGVLTPLPYPWRISSQDWARIKNNSHLQDLADLIDESQLTDFQLRLRTSLLAYSKGLTLRDPGDRLVYTLSALEGLLLRDNSEPIQQNLGERMAFLLEKDPSQRQDIVRNVRDIYQARSRYIHHRISVSEEAAMEKFVVRARAAFEAALANARQVKTGLEFIEAIDRVKFGGLG
jgi:hypothetical protein